jgi:hypothetical protein
MSPPEVPTVVYVHGAGNKPPRDALKLACELVERHITVCLPVASV